jgi:hypothetical protein
VRKGHRFSGRGPRGVFGGGAPGRWVNNAVTFWGGAGPPGGRTHLILVPDWTGVAREGRASSELDARGRKIQKEGVESLVVAGSNTLWRCVQGARRPSLPRSCTAYR